MGKAIGTGIVFTESLPVRKHQVPVFQTLKMHVLVIRQTLAVPPDFHFVKTPSIEPLHTGIAADPDKTGSILHDGVNMAVQ
jgi:hypothetical protein